MYGLVVIDDGKKNMFKPLFTFTQLICSDSDLIGDSTHGNHPILCYTLMRNVQEYLHLLYLLLVL